MVSTLFRGGARLACVLLALAAVETPSLQAQSRVLETAIKFYSDGGSYCFRILPPGVAPPNKSSETEWTLMVLTAKSNQQNSFKYGDIQQPGKSGFDLVSEGLAVQIVWVENRKEFFTRFADGIKAGLFRARVVKTSPIKAGAEVSFAKASDLEPDEFLMYITYILE